MSELISKKLTDLCRLLTPFVRVFEGKTIEDFKSIFCAAGKASIILVERCVHNRIIAITALTGTHLALSSVDDLLGNGLELGGLALLYLLIVGRYLVSCGFHCYFYI